MEDKELDLSKVNQIDMECNCADDDDGFGGFKTESISTTGGHGSAGDDREINTKLGVFADFSDDDNKGWIEKPLVVESEQDILNAKNGLLGKHAFENAFNSEDGFKGINEIDMECNCCEDEDDADYIPAPKRKSIFDDDFDDKELVDEDILGEKKTKSVSTGEVEDDYYEKLKKKHAKTNVKGAYNTHFHFCGDPEAEMDMFNHDMKSALPSGGASISGNITGTALGADSVAVGGEASGMGEAIEEEKPKVINDAPKKSEKNYIHLLEDILVITGFDLTQKDDGTFVLHDNVCNNDICCDSKEGAIEALKPYVSDCFVCPTAVTSGEDLKTCEDCCNWYTPEMASKYPDCKKDIEYCDFIAHHPTEWEL